MKKKVLMMVLTIIGIFCVLMIGKTVWQKKMAENERFLKNADLIETVNFYELTENNFITGIDYFFIPEEVEALRNSIREKAYHFERGYMQEEEEKYFLYLYDKEDMELKCFAVDSALRIYMGNGEFFVDEILTDLLKVKVQEYNK